ncbi:type III pantothenate kinase [Ascidiimonas sp. W6]|uniref:type III pantothenate kinase n=1 Tax=Ascidiimonas meishanensis TaxID=3128903 RepID=UPI0030EE9120
MNLIVDVGNTLIKVAVFDRNFLIYETSFKSLDSNQNFKNILEKQHCTHAIISSVVDKEIMEILKNYSNLQVLNLTSDTPIPFFNAYASPKTLGVDRIALAAAAFCEYPRKNVLVIDAGTCITYDFVHVDGTYMGGSIAPGLKMRYASLHHFTARLPLLDEYKEPEMLIGNTTENSIRSGVYYGLIYEIQGVIAQYVSLFEDLTVILTGGDMQILSKTLKNTIFANPKFLIQGLNHILEYNKHG